MDEQECGSKEMVADGKLVTYIIPTHRTDFATLHNDYISVAHVLSIFTFTIYTKLNIKDTHKTKDLWFKMAEFYKDSEFPVDAKRHC